MKPPRVRYAEFCWRDRIHFQTHPRYIVCKNALFGRTFEHWNWECVWNQFQMPKPHRPINWSPFQLPLCNWNFLLSMLGSYWNGDGWLNLPSGFNHIWVEQVQNTNCCTADAVHVKQDVLKFVKSLHRVKTPTSFHLFIHSFVQLFIHSFICSFTEPFILSSAIISFIFSSKPSFTPTLGTGSDLESAQTWMFVTKAQTDCIYFGKEVRGQSSCDK